MRSLFPSARRLLVNQSVKRLSLDKYKRILVVGAGHDPYARLFSNVELYTKLDINPILGITDLVADAHFLPIKNGAYDCVIAVEVLEHLEDPQVFIDEVYRVLSDKGVFVLTVPFIFHMHADPNDFLRPTREALKLWLSSFSSMEISSQGNRVHVLSDLITTAFHPYSIFIFFRIFNYLIILPNILFFGVNNSTAVSGHMVVSVK